jgi:hypothetical protein
MVKWVMILFLELDAAPEGLNSKTTSMCNTTFILFDNIILLLGILATLS